MLQPGPDAGREWRGRELCTLPNVRGGLGHPKRPPFRRAIRCSLRHPLNQRLQHPNDLRVALLLLRAILLQRPRLHRLKLRVLLPLRLQGHLLHLHQLLH